MARIALRASFVFKNSLQPETNSLVISYVASGLIHRVSRCSTAVSERVSSVAIKITQT
jgi:hypothetical protein